MKNVMLTFISWLKAGLAKLEADLEAIGSALWPAIESAFTSAEQAEIASLIPIAEGVVNQLNVGDNPKQMFSDGLVALESSVISAGKTFVLTFATQALTIAIDNLKGNTGNGNSGVLNGGVQTTPTA